MAISLRVKINSELQVHPVDESWIGLSSASIHHLFLLIILVAYGNIEAIHTGCTHVNKRLTNDCPKYQWEYLKDPHENQLKSQIFGVFMLISA